MVFGGVIQLDIFAGCYGLGRISGSFSAQFIMEGFRMDENKQAIIHKTVKTGITFGSALAMVISYTNWHSVGWAIFHGLLSWGYVLYFMLKY